MVPLVVVAGLIAANLNSERVLRKEADALSSMLDRALDRQTDGQVNRLAILPLQNVSGRLQLDYLTTGIAGDIRDQLAGVNELTVIGMQSSSNVADQQLSLESMARMLGAGHILAGSVAGTEDNLTITLELHNLEGDAQIAWRENWQSTANALPTTTQAIAARVLSKVLPGGQGTNATWPTRTAPASGAALDNYLRGKYLIDRYNREEVLDGIAYLERAIAADPGFERAYWAKITGHQRMTWIDAQVAADHVRYTEATIDAYFARKEKTPLTFRLQALRASKALRPLEASVAFRKAVQLAPHEYAYDRGYMVELCSAGFLERCLEQATGLAREDPVSAAAHTSLAIVYFLRGQPDKQLEHARLSARFGGELGSFLEGEALLQKGQWEAARASLTRGLDAVEVDSRWVSPYVDAIAGQGSADVAVDAMRAIDKSSAEWLDLLYSEYAAIGRLDLAFEAARTLVAERYETWNLYVWEPQMASFRNDPRFIDLMRDMGLIELWNTLGLPDTCSGETVEPFCTHIDRVSADRPGGSLPASTESDSAS